MTIGEQIQKIRIEKGLTQERLAELLDVSRQSVSKWELGVSLSLGYQTILTLTIFYYSNSVVPVNPQHYINITVSEISEHVDNNHILWFGIPVLHSINAMIFMIKTNYPIFNLLLLLVICRFSVSQVIIVCIGVYCKTPQ